MNKNKYIYILCFIILVFSCREDGLEIDGSGNIIGTVLDGEENTPLVDVSITTSPVTKTIKTDENGEFIFDNIDAASYTLRFELEGYTTKSANVLVKDDEEVTVDLEMNSDDRFNDPPFIPTVVAPEVGELLTNIESVTLSWDAMDVNNDDLTYSLRIYNDDLTLDEMLLTESMDTSFVFEDLQYSTTYFWQVIVKDEINDEIFGEVWNFKTIDFPLYPIYYVQEGESGGLQIHSTDLTNELPITFEPVSRWKPRMSYSREKVAFLANDNIDLHLFTMNFDGSEQKKISLTSVAGIFPQELNYSWMPFDQGLVYPHFNQIYQVRIDGSQSLAVFTTAENRTINECTVSPTNGDIALIETNLQGQNSHILLLSPSGDILDTLVSRANGRLGGLHFSASGTELLYTHDLSEVTTVTGRQLNQNIFRHDIVADTTFNVSVNKLDGFNDLEPRYSPNNGKIIFTNRDNTKFGPGTIMIMDIDGTDREVLVEDAFMGDMNG